MENNDISVETQLKRAFGRAQLLYEIPPILSVEVWTKVFGMNHIWLLFEQDVVGGTPNVRSIVAYLAYFRDLKTQEEEEANSDRCFEFQDTFHPFVLHLSYFQFNDSHFFLLIHTIIFCSLFCSFFLINKEMPPCTVLSCCWFWVRNGFSSRNQQRGIWTIFLLKFFESSNFLLRFSSTSFKKLKLKERRKKLLKESTHLRRRRRKTIWRINLFDSVGFFIWLFYWFLFFQVDLDDAFAVLFRNVKVEQPGETFLPFECTDAGIVDNKRFLRSLFLIKNLSWLFF